MKYLFSSNPLANHRFIYERGGPDPVARAQEHEANKAEKADKAPRDFKAEAAEGMRQTEAAFHGACATLSPDAQRIIPVELTQACKEGISNPADLARISHAADAAEVEINATLAGLANIDQKADIQHSPEALAEARAFLEGLQAAMARAEAQMAALDKANPGNPIIEKGIASLAKTKQEIVELSENGGDIIAAVENRLMQPDPVSKGLAKAREAQKMGLQEGPQADAWMEENGVNWDSEAEPWCAAGVCAAVGPEVTNGLQGGALNLPKAAGGKEIAMSSVAGMSTIGFNEGDQVSNRGSTDSYENAYLLSDGTKVVTKRRKDENGDMNTGRGHIAIVDSQGEGGGEAPTKMT